MYKPILFYGVLTLVFGVCVLLSLYQPKAMAPWFRPASRFKAALLYGGFAIIFGFATLLSKPTYPELTTPQRMHLYCSYEKGKARIERETTKMFGRFPRNTLKAGDIITAEQPTPLLITNDPNLKTPQDVIESTVEVISIPRSGQFKIIRVIRDFSSGFHWYRAKDLATSQQGYIETDALSWYDTPARIADYGRRKEVWMKPKRQKLERTLFVENGIDPEEIKAQAREEAWARQCP
ncbi:hypothetical protein [Desulfovibrio inopinatus]|uniref:hypothetical protein n=1 Tax=Desulfovibrio inopinatus TaxID=102109 RepID=UPI000405036C|nr:hypothetical protein [Desulfovibrio inopinatus]